MPDAYVFRGCQYPTQARMLDALVEGWIEADGWNNPDEALADSTDLELAADCVSAWELGVRHGDEPAHVLANDYSLNDLEAAFARYRARRAGTKT